MNIEGIRKFYNEHKWEVIGTATGLFISIAILVIGLLKTLFIAICAGIGYYIGKRLSEDKDYLKNLLDKILPPGSYR